HNKTQSGAEYAPKTKHTTEHDATKTSGVYRISVQAMDLCVSRIAAPLIPVATAHPSKGCCLKHLTTRARQPHQPGVSLAKPTHMVARRNLETHDMDEVRDNHTPQASQQTRLPRVIRRPQ